MLSIWLITNAFPDRSIEIPDPEVNSTAPASSLMEVTIPVARGSIDAATKAKPATCAKAVGCITYRSEGSA